jgi:hypothetical protein
MNQTIENNIEEISLNEIKKFAENTESNTRVLPDDCPVGSGGRQGDVYLIRLASFNSGKSKLTHDRQLAPGNTQGSRHTVDENVQVWIPKDGLKDQVITTEFGLCVMGPVVTAKERWTLSHPDHANFSAPAGDWQISYQVDPIRQARVLD